MTTYAFDSEADFQRAARAIVRSERTPVNQPKKRARWQGGVGDGGGGLRPYIITEVGVGDANVVAHRCSSPIGSQRCESAWVGDGTDVAVDLSQLQGVTATGCVVWCSRAFGTLYAIGGGQASEHLIATADAEILVGESGDVTVSYLDADGVGQTAPLANVPNQTGMVIPADAAVTLSVYSLSCSIVIDGLECSG